MRGFKAIARAVDGFGWVVAALFGGILVGEQLARRRFDDAFEAKFGGDDGDGGGGEGRWPSKDDPAGIGVTAADVDVEALPESKDAKTGARVVWIVPGPQGEDS